MTGQQKWEKHRHYSKGHREARSIRRACLDGTKTHSWWRCLDCAWTTNDALSDPVRGQKPQSWAGPAVSAGRQRRVSCFLGSPRGGIRSSIPIRRPCGARSGARSRPGADVSA